MDIEIVYVVRHHGVQGDDPVLHFWTDAPVAPYWAVAGSQRQTITVPTKSDAQTLLVSQYVWVTSDEGRKVRTHCGDAAVQRGDFNVDGESSVTLLNEQGDDMGLVKFRITNGYQLMAGKAFHINSPETKRRCAEIMERSSVWHNSKAGGLAAYDSELENVYIKYLPGMYPHLPGWFFAVHRTTGSEDESFILNALTCAARRRCITPAQLGAMADKVVSVFRQPSQTYHTPPVEAVTMAHVVVEAAQMVANFIPYETDQTFFNGDAETIDHFDTGARVHRSGDCEDLAREIITLLDSVRAGPAPQTEWASPVVLAAQIVLRTYVAMEVLGAVALKPDKSLSAFSVGKGKSCFAHAWVMLVSTKRFEHMLLRSKSLELDAWALDPWVSSSLPTLTADGVRINDVNAPTPSWRPKKVRLRTDMWERVRQTERIKGSAGASEASTDDWTGYYRAVSCGYVLGGLVYKGTTVVVPELYFINFKDRVRGNTFGASYEQLHDFGTDVRVEPTAQFSASDIALAQKCMTFYHPVRPYKPPPKGASGKALDAISVGAQDSALYPPKLVEFVTDPDMRTTGQTVTFTERTLSCLVLGCDVEDEAFRKKLKEALNEYSRRPANVVPMYCGPDAYGVHLEYDVTDAGGGAPVTPALTTRAASPRRARKADCRNAHEDEASRRRAATLFAAKTILFES